MLCGLLPELNEFRPVVVVMPPAALWRAEALLKAPLFEPASAAAILARMKPDTFQASHTAGKRVTRCA